VEYLSTLAKRTQAVNLVESFLWYMRRASKREKEADPAHWILRSSPVDIAPSWPFGDSDDHLLKLIWLVVAFC
jgi:hypothetical protein